MLWVVAAVGVLVVLSVVWAVRRGGGIQAKHMDRFENGLRATATIDEVEQPGGGPGHRSTLVVRLRLTVSPPGGEPYAAVTGVRVKLVDLPNAQPGRTMDVRIATDEPKLVYPDVPWGSMELVIIARAAREG